MNIYVGNLSWDISNEQLQDLFTPYGEVSSARIVTDKFKNNRSKGFGFIEMPNDEEAKQAIDAMNDQEVMGRKLIVNEAKPQTEREPRSFGGGGGGRRFDNGGGGNRFSKGGSGGGGFKKRY